MTGPLVEAAAELLRFFDRQQRPVCLIGGVVVTRWGAPRTTKDVDATVLGDFSHAPGSVRLAWWLPSLAGAFAPGTETQH